MPQTPLQHVGAIYTQQATGRVECKIRQVNAHELSQEEKTTLTGTYLVCHEQLADLNSLQTCPLNVPGYCHHHCA